MALESVKVYLKDIYQTNYEGNLTSFDELVGTYGYVYFDLEHPEYTIEQSIENQSLMLTAGIIKNDEYGAYVDYIPGTDFGQIMSNNYDVNRVIQAQGRITIPGQETGAHTDLTVIENQSSQDVTSVNPIDEFGNINTSTSIFNISNFNQIIGSDLLLKFLGLNNSDSFEYFLDSDGNIIKNGDDIVTDLQTALELGAVYGRLRFTNIFLGNTKYILENEQDLTSKSLNKIPLSTIFIPEFNVNVFNKDCRLSENVVNLLDEPILDMCNIPLLRGYDSPLRTIRIGIKIPQIGYVIDRTYIDENDITNTILDIDEPHQLTTIFDEDYSYHDIYFSIGVSTLKANTSTLYLSEIHVPDLRNGVANNFPLLGLNETLPNTTVVSVGDFSDFNSADDPNYGNYVSTQNEKDNLFNVKLTTEPTNERSGFIIGLAPITDGVFDKNLVKDYQYGNYYLAPMTDGILNKDNVETLPLDFENHINSNYYITDPVHDTAAIINPNMNKDSLMKYAYYFGEVNNINRKRIPTIFHTVVKDIIDLKYTKDPQSNIYSFAGVITLALYPTSQSYTEGDVTTEIDRIRGVKTEIDNSDPNNPAITTSMIEGVLNTNKVMGKLYENPNNLSNYNKRKPVGLDIFKNLYLSTDGTNVISYNDIECVYMNYNIKFDVDFKTNTVMNTYVYPALNVNAQFNDGQLEPITDDGTIYTNYCVYMLTKGNNINE